ncbi:MAG: hypothetical protein ACYSUQ_10405, partial [Planctomycetota bacterium]
MKAAARERISLAIVVLTVICWGTTTHGDPLDLSIYDVQYTEDPDGISDYSLQTHNVLGGVVIHIKPWGSKPRVYLQDPAYSAWGGVVVKDWTGGGLAHNVAVGDRIDLANVLIEEASGTTTLQYGGFLAPHAAISLQEPGHPLPTPVVLTAAGLAAPVYDSVEDTWFVVDHSSEPYEGMLATLLGVTVGSLDLGKAGDNYELLQGSDVAWAADFLNWDAGGLYHPRIFAGADLASITGIVEQYLGETDEGTLWDYYQLFTRTTADIVPRLRLWLDIKPGACPNSFNPRSHGFLPVALMSTDEVDVSEVDITTVYLSRGDGLGGAVSPHEGPPGPHSLYADVATPFEGEACDCHQLEGDGIMDLSMKFSVDAVVGALELYKGMGHV